MFSLRRHYLNNQWTRIAVSSCLWDRTLSANMRCEPRTSWVRKYDPSSLLSSLSTRSTFASIVASQTVLQFSLAATSAFLCSSMWLTLGHTLNSLMVLDAIGAATESVSFPPVSPCDVYSYFQQKTCVRSQLMFECISVQFLLVVL